MLKWAQFRSPIMTICSERLQKFSRWLGQHTWFSVCYAWSWGFFSASTYHQIINSDSIFSHLNIIYNLQFTNSTIVCLPPNKIYEAMAFGFTWHSSKAFFIITKNPWWWMINKTPLVFFSQILFYEKIFNRF